MKIDTVLKVLVESLFQDRTASWVRIVSGIDKYVKESMQTKEEEHRASGRLVAKARTPLKPAVTLSSVSILGRDRKRIGDLFWQKEQVSIWLESKLFQPLPVPQSNSRTFRK